MPGPRRVRDVVFAALMLASIALAAASEPNYRLAGIVAAGRGSIALIELPDGRQRFFRSGDALGTGTIRDITPAGVRIELAHEDLMLRLRGSPTLVASARSDAPSDDNATSEEDARSDDDAPSAEEETEAEQPTVSHLQLGSSEAAGLLTAARRASDPEPGEVPLSQESLREQLQSLLEVPAETQVVAVDGVPMQTPQEVIRALAARLGESSTVRLSLSGPGALRTIVVNSDTEQ